MKGGYSNVGIGIKIGRSRIVMHKSVCGRTWKEGY